MKQAGKQLGTIFALITLLLLSTLFYLYVDKHLQQQHNPNTQLVSQANGSQFVLQASRDGHYRVRGKIADQTVDFMIDTGASSVAVNTMLAERLRLKKQRKIQISTANGITTGWTTTIPSITIAGITLYDIRGTITDNLNDEILLGMSYLNHFEFTQRQQQLTLRRKPTP